MQNWEPTYMIKFTNPTNKPGHGKAWWAIIFVQDDKMLLFEGITWSDHVHRIIQFNIYKVRQLEELCGDCLNIWGRAVFLFNFHESLRWHVLHREQIAQKLRLFIICILIRGTVDSCWATWHVDCGSLALRLVEGILRSTSNKIWDICHTDLYIMNY